MLHPWIMYGLMACWFVIGLVVGEYVTRKVITRASWKVSARMVKKLTDISYRENRGVRTHLFDQPCVITYTEDFTE